jgi:hypothetical protein
MIGDNVGKSQKCNRGQNHWILYKRKAKLGRQLLKGKISEYYDGAKDSEYYDGAPFTRK